MFLITLTLEECTVVEANRQVKVFMVPKMGYRHWLSELEEVSKINSSNLLLSR